MVMQYTKIVGAIVALFVLVIHVYVCLIYFCVF